MRHLKATLRARTELDFIPSEMGGVKMEKGSDGPSGKHQSIALKVGVGKAGSCHFLLKLGFIGTHAHPSQSVYGLVYALRTELSNCCRDHRTHKAGNIDYLAIYGKSLLTFMLNSLGRPDGQGSLMQLSSRVIRIGTQCEFQTGCGPSSATNQLCDLNHVS